MTKITLQHIQKILEASKIETSKLGTKTTLVHITLPNGFELVQTSSCVDPANYDHDLGVSNCKKRALDKIWELEGYLLQSKIKEGDNGLQI